MKSVKLQIRGVGHIPAFKNRKRSVVDQQSGEVITFTQKDIKLIMEQIIQSIGSQLYLECPIDERGIRTVPLLRSWIASSLPLDDSMSWVPRGLWDVEYVEKGEEGADILIEQI